MSQTTIQSEIESAPLPTFNLGTYSNALTDDNLKDILLGAGAMNFVDKGAYPGIVAMEEETVRFLLGLMHGAETGMGFATTGSSEAIILSLAWHHRNYLKAHPEKKPADLNFIINRGYHKAFDKYAQLFGVKLRPAPLNQNLSVDVAELEKLIDEDTFCIVGIAGSTELGMVDDIQSIAKLAEARDIPMHIDAAIGGYVLPFTDSAKPWDFALPAVKTMNISGHKYGLCLPGIGFLLARDNSVMPDSYSGEIAYLSGGGICDNALSCTRNAAFVVNAYHNMREHGETGYRVITKQNFENASYLADALNQIGGVEEVIKGNVPVVLVRTERMAELSGFLSERNWIQSPHFIKHLGHEYIRIVIRRHTDRAMLERFVADIQSFYS